MVMENMRLNKYIFNNNHMIIFSEFASKMFVPQETLHSLTRMWFSKKHFHSRHSLKKFLHFSAFVSKGTFKQSFCKQT